MYTQAEGENSDDCGQDCWGVGRSLFAMYDPPGLERHFHANTFSLLKREEDPGEEANHDKITPISSTVRKEVTDGDWKEHKMPPWKRQGTQEGEQVRTEAGRRTRQYEEHAAEIVPQRPYIEA